MKKLARTQGNGTPPVGRDSSVISDNRPVIPGDHHTIDLTGGEEAASARKQIDERIRDKDLSQRDVQERDLRDQVSRDKTALNDKEPVRHRDNVTHNSGSNYEDIVVTVKNADKNPDSFNREDRHVHNYLNAAAPPVQEPQYAKREHTPPPTRLTNLPMPPSAEDDSDVERTPLRYE